MGTQIKLLACAAAILAMPVGVIGQEKPDPPPVPFTGRFTGPGADDFDGFHTVFELGRGVVQRHQRTIIATDSRCCYAYTEWAVDSRAGICDNWFLCNTPLGAFSAYVDAKASAAGGLGVGVNYYVWEGVVTSFRWDLLRRQLVVTTTLVP
jgi:hypothetical protein